MRRILFRVHLAALLGLGTLAAQAQPTQPIDTRAIAPYLQQVGAMDLQRGSWAIQRGDSVTEARIGPGDVQPARIGSISKLFTAVIVLQLMEEGRLKLSDPVSRWFPSLPQAEQTTVEMLLRHRGGFGDWASQVPHVQSWITQPRTQAEMLALVAAAPREFEPGARMRYSNSGFLLLTWIAEQAGEKPYATLLAERITEPLQLTRTHVTPGKDEGGSAIWVELSEGVWGWQAERVTHATIPSGAGAAVSTPAELTRFMRAVFRGSLLKPETRALLQTVQDGFGLGFARVQGRADQPTGFGHGGVIDGFRSHVMYLPGPDLAVAVLLSAERLPLNQTVAQLVQSQLNPAHRAPDLTPKLQRWHLPVTGPALQPGERLALRGDHPPLSWRKGLPVGADGRLNFEWQGIKGLPLQAKLVVENAQGEVQRWELGNNRRFMPGSPPEMLRFDLKDERLAIYNEVLAADRAMFAAFNARDLVAFAPFFSDRLEFFHDNGGMANKAQTVAQFTQNFARKDQRIRRELLLDGMEVHPLPGVGAMQIGRHRFCSKQGSEPEQCETFGFSTVWEKTAQGWQQLRVLSYGH